MKRRGRSELKIEVEIEFDRRSCTYEKQSESDPLSLILETSRVEIGFMKLEKKTIRALHAEQEVETLGKTKSGSLECADFDRSESAGVCSASETPKNITDVGESCV